MKVATRIRLTIGVVLSVIGRNGMTSQQPALQERSHTLKTDHNAWEDIACGRKQFEVRLNDRFYQRGDTLELWRIEGNYMRAFKSILKARIGYVHSGLGMDQSGCGYLVLGLLDVEGPFDRDD